jgi:predicted nucleic acid-binding protein
LKKHHKRRRSLQAQREMFRELDERERAQYQLATVSDHGFVKRIDAILAEIKIQQSEKEEENK